MKPTEATNKSLKHTSLQREKEHETLLRREDNTREMLSQESICLVENLSSESIILHPV